MGRLRTSVAELMILVLGVGCALVSLRFASEVWAGAVLLLTLGLLVIAILGVVYRQGAARASWLGFALLGWGYMVLASGSWWDRTTNRPELFTTLVLDELYEELQPESNPTMSSSLFAGLLGPDPRTRLILEKLEEPIPMQFPNETPLEEILNYIKKATKKPKDDGIPIYVEVEGLHKAKRTLTSPVILDVVGVPLKTTLKLAFGQLGLSYTVKDGILTITNASSTRDVVGSFRRIGHCYCALFAGWIGAIAGRFFYATRDRVRER